jgi:hypothetical protein
MRLKRDQKRLAREVARDLWIQFSGNFGKCRRAFRKDPRLVGFDVATILLMIQIAVALWRLWQSLKLTEPPVVAMSEESVALGSDFFE